MIHEQMHTSEIADTLKEFSLIIGEFRASLSEEETVFSWDVWTRQSGEEE